MTPQPVRDTKWLAEYFSRKPKTIREWIRRGTLPAKKVGGGWYVKDRDLLRVID